jgi:hypothetical protein
MSDDLRDAIAAVVDPFKVFTASDGHPGIRTREPKELADAVLYMPEIVDMLALRRMCGDLTTTQVAQALQFCRDVYATNNWDLTDDEKAIANWREPT